MTPRKSCRETVELLMDYLDGTLPPGDQAALDAHFAACPPCLDFVRSYRETPRILREATKVEMPPEVGRRLEQFLREQRESRRGDPREEPA